MLILLDRLHTLPPPARSYEKSDILGMDRRALVWADYAAGGWSHCGQVKVEVGTPKAFHDRRCSGRGRVSACTRVDC